MEIVEDLLVLDDVTRSSGSLHTECPDDLLRFGATCWTGREKARTEAHDHISRM